MPWLRSFNKQGNEERRIAGIALVDAKVNQVVAYEACSVMVVGNALGQDGKRVGFAAVVTP